MEVFIFATSVQSVEEARKLALHLDSLAGKGSWNFALDDCDKILRIVSATLKPEAVINLLSRFGYRCLELSDEIILVETSIMAEKSKILT